MEWQEGVQMFVLSPHWALSPRPLMSWVISQLFTSLPNLSNGSLIWPKRTALPPVSPEHTHLDPSQAPVVWPWTLHDCLQAQLEPRKLRKPQRNPAASTAAKGAITAATATRTTKVKERMIYR